MRSEKRADLIARIVIELNAAAIRPQPEPLDQAERLRARAARECVLRIVMHSMMQGRSPSPIAAHLADLVPVVVTTGMPD